MKSFAAACVFLALTVAGAIWSSVWLGGVAGELKSMADALPPPDEAAEAAENGSGLREATDGIVSYWEGKAGAASLLVGEREAGAVTAAVASLRAAALSGDPGEYGSAREALLAAARDLAFAAGFY